MAGRWTSLASTASGHVFARSTPALFDRWDWIVDTVAAEFNCNATDVTSYEDEDGNDLVKVHDQIVAQIFDGFIPTAKPYEAPKPVVTHTSEDIVKSIRALCADGSPVLSDTEAALMINLYASVAVTKREQELA